MQFNRFVYHSRRGYGKSGGDPLKLFAIIAAIFVFASVCSAQTVTLGSPETVMTPSQIAGHGLTVFPDSNLHCQFFNSTNQCWAANGSAVNAQGITSVALNSLQANLMTITTGTNIPLGSSGSFDQDYAGGGAIFYDAADNILFMEYHGEFHYTGSLTPSYGALGLAYSTDLGATWHKLGEVISPQTARSGSCQVDPGEGTLVPVTDSGVDYLYSMYVDEGSGCNGGNFNPAMARAKVSDIIAAGLAGTPFTSGAGTLFMKWTGSGWTGDGVTDLANPAAGGGAFQALITGNLAWVPSFAYNSAISKYVMTYAAGWTGIGLRFGTDPLTWGAATQIVSGGSTPPSAIFYPAPLNTAGGNPEVLGSTFYVYYDQPFGNWSNTNLMRISVTVPTAPGTDVYISQAGGGAGTSCSSPFSASFFNTSGNWPGTIGPGTTVHFCGTITSTLTFQGSGTSGNPITLHAESGAKLSQPVGNLINLNGQSNLVIDGGTIENTANGAALANHVNTQGIFASGASNIEIKNLTCQNIYVAVPPTAIPGIDDTLNNCVYSNGISGTISIHDSTFDGAGWLINLGGLANGSAVTVNKMVFNHFDHAVVAGDGTNSYTVSVCNSHFKDSANWDTSSDTYHHDPLHVYNGSGGPGSWGTDKYTFCNNLFDGNRGNNFTADIFYENGSATEPQVTDFNNIHIQTPGVLMSNGFVAVGDGNALGSLSMLNDTFLCDPTVNGQSGVRIIATTLAFKDNLINGCNSLLSVENGSAGGSGINFNIYAQQGAGGNFRWNWEAIGGTNTLSTWQSNCGSCDLNSSYQTSAMVSSTGQPLSGSPLLGAGTNLTSLCSGALTPLCSDINGVARPAVGAWTVGAYQGSGGGGFIATPSIFGIAVQ